MCSCKKKTNVFLNNTDDDEKDATAVVVARKKALVLQQDEEEHTAACPHKEKKDGEDKEDEPPLVCLSAPPYTEEQLGIMARLNGSADKTPLYRFQAALSNEHKWRNSVTRWNSETRSLDTVPVEVVSVCFLSVPQGVTQANMAFVRRTVETAFADFNVSFAWLPFDARITEFDRDADVIINQTQANAWTNDLNLAQRRALAPVVRIDLTPGNVAWASMGRLIPFDTVTLQNRRPLVTSNRVNSSQPSMRLGRLDNGPGEVGTVIVHEFMHIFGFIHDHQREDFLNGSTVPLRDNATLLRVWRRVYGLNENDSSADDTIEQNVLGTMSIDTANSSAGFDPHSIMIYPWPCDAFYANPGFLCTGTPTTWNLNRRPVHRLPNTTLSYLNRVSLRNLFPFEGDTPYREISGEQYVVPLENVQAKSKAQVLQEEKPERKEEKEEEEEYSGPFPTAAEAATAGGDGEQIKEEVEETVELNRWSIIFFVVFFVVVLIALVLACIYGRKTE